MFLQPERIKGEEYSIHSEVWSLGVSLFEVGVLLFCDIFMFSLQ